MKETKRAKRYEIAKVVLIALAAAGALMIPVAGPLALLAIAEELKIGKFSNRRVSQSLRGLQQRKIIGISQEGDNTVVRLTKDGQVKLLKYKLEDMKINKPTHWDKKWRVVVFDIPEKFKVAREYLRAKLKELGFYRLQKSVWIYPYPCMDEIDFIRELYEVRPFVTIMTVSEIDVKQKLFKHFDL